MTTTPSRTRRLAAAAAHAARLGEPAARAATLTVSAPATPAAGHMARACFIRAASPCF